MSGSKHVQGLGAVVGEWRSKQGRTESAWAQRLQTALQNMGFTLTQAVVEQDLQGITLVDGLIKMERFSEWPWVGAELTPQQTPGTAPRLADPPSALPGDIEPPKAEPFVLLFIEAMKAGLVSTSEDRRALKKFLTCMQEIISDAM